MTARERLNLSIAQIESFCKKNNIQKLAFFGSVLRDDFKPESDVDVLVEFSETSTAGLIEISMMELELADLLKRKVDLRTKEDLSYLFRDKVIASAEVLYARG